MADLHEDLNFGISLDPKPTKEDSLKPEPVKKYSSEQENRPKVTDQAIAASTTDSYDLKRAGHPTACIATFIFKGLAIFWYLFVGNFISDIMTFIFVIIFSALDFWTVKNVTGRLLVGLRWWSQNTADGKEEWKFQSREGTSVNNPVDKAFFWTSQLAGTGVWAILLLLKILTLSIFWGLLLSICTSLCGTNLYGYYQCRGDHQKKLKDLKTEYGKQGLMHLAGQFM